MTVLKKFGFSIFTLLLVSIFSIAQTNEKSTQNILLLKPEVVQYNKQFLPTSNINDKVNASSTKVNNDVYNSRLVKKESTAKKTEPSFATDVMDWVKEKYADMIHVMPNQLSNVMLYSFIDDWYGTKYRMGGTSKKGIDCSAFTQNLYKYVFGMNIVRTACLQFNASERIKNISDLKEGDLVFFRVNTSRISHVGVYLSNNFFVHSASSKGVSIASLNNAYWSKYYAGGGRIVKQ